MKRQNSMDRGAPGPRARACARAPPRFSPRFSDRRPSRRRPPAGDAAAQLAAAASIGNASQISAPEAGGRASSGAAPALADAARLAHSFPQSRAEGAAAARVRPPSAAAACPPYGSKSVIGRRAKMEDACVVVPHLLEVPLAGGAAELLPPRLAPPLRSAAAAARGGSGVVLSGNTVDGADAESPAPRRWAPAPPLPPYGDDAAETLHFFGVFDGHGGADAALHCADTLHVRVREALAALAGGAPAAAPAAAPRGAAGAAGLAAVDEACCIAAADTGEASTTHVRGAHPPRSANSGDGSLLFDASRADSGASASGAAESPFGRAATAPPAPPPPPSHAAAATAAPRAPAATPEAVEAALTRAFHLADEEFGALGGYERLALVGTTAVVALVGGRWVYVANCGDSRAVLCRAGAALALSDDHKAAREDETARVEAAGGQILFWNGVRVMGLLAVSRAIGDHSLRPYVIAEPEVTAVARDPADELLVLASDGLWDVMGNQEACTLARRCLARARSRGSSRQNAARVAATVLTRAAVDRGSRDNVTVVVVDLASGEDEEGGGAAAAAAAALGEHSNSLPPAASARGDEASGGAAAPGGGGGGAVRGAPPSAAASPFGPGRRRSASEGGSGVL